MDARGGQVGDLKGIFHVAGGADNGDSSSVGGGAAVAWDHFEDATDEDFGAFSSGTPSIRRSSAADPEDDDDEFGTFSSAPPSAAEEVPPPNKAHARQTVQHEPLKMAMD